MRPHANNKDKLMLVPFTPETSLEGGLAVCAACSPPVCGNCARTLCTQCAAKHDRNAATGVVPFEEYSKLVEKYNQLKSLRMTDAEQNLDRLRRDHETSAAASAKLIEQLRAELASATRVGNSSEELLRIREENALLKLQLTEQDAKMDAKQQAESDLTAQLTLYETLSAVRMNDLGDGKFECECSDPRDSARNVRFVLTFKPDEVEYSPLASTATHFVPSYLKESTICFDETQLPLLISKLVTAIYKK
eukprot:TRINITY_DN2643_c0_g1_i1.p2 TRINITY_DN2643_c0_g1~~TRINITY_DN2643_c0_g1_i1.p2  ORF type:complete len:249 (+),score=92.43 TRINITY_DN2643_c0_g1_i1:703-1449(+)